MLYILQTPEIKHMCSLYQIYFYMMDCNSNGIFGPSWFLLEMQLWYNVNINFK